MPSSDAQRYFVIPLSVQEEGEAYIVGNVEMGDFYQFPEQGLKILNMLASGDTASMIRNRLALEYQETIDVDDFVDQLTAIGFIHPEDQKQIAQERLRATAQDRRRTFIVDPRIARAILSRPASLCYLAAVFYALFIAIRSPELCINFDAFYIGTYRTPFLLIVIALSFMQTILHELGHMLAAARYGIKSKYGVGTRLWELVVESDLTGILTLPKSQRYFPMLAGMLVDILGTALLTIIIYVLLQYGVSGFAIQVFQAVVLANVFAFLWQFDIFVKTDIYYVLCNYFSYPDLDKDARIYLRDLLYHITFSRFGDRAVAPKFGNLAVIKVFSLIWLFGRILSLAFVFSVVLPTMGQYILSIAHMVRMPSTSIWSVCDMVVYASILLSMLSIGTYMWLKQR
jgi:putative peptide zinc metalloprotease protein